MTIAWTGNRRRAARLAAALALLAAAVSADGQAGVWSTHGPVGGNIRCIVPDPSNPAIVYAGTDDGCFKSVDGGATWAPASNGLPSDRVQTIAVDPGSPNTLYAGTLTPDGVASDGMFKSTDGGATWSAINDGLVDPTTGIGPLDVRTIAIDPSDSNTLLAGTRFSEIFRSTDGGATWQPQTLGGFNISLETSAFRYDTTNPSIVYAASTDGLLSSGDDGVSWAEFGDLGLPIFALAIDPTTPDTLYAGNDTGYGIYKSTDGGAHWVAANTGIPDQGGAGAGFSLVIALALDPSSSGTLYAGTAGDGLFRSTDGGATWTAADDGLPSVFVSALAIAQQPSPAVFAGMLGAGISRSPDAGATWTPSAAGIDQSLVSALVEDPQDGGRLAASAFDGVWTSSDAGETWDAPGAGLPRVPVGALTVTPGALLAGTLGSGLYSSADAGNTWTAIAASPNPFISALAADPNAPDVVYAGTADPTSGVSQRVFKSSDGGATWTETGLDAKSLAIAFIAVNPANSSQIAAVSSGQSSYFQSSDGGVTWTTVSVDAACGGVLTLLYSGTSILLGTTAGVCRSANGSSWTVTAVAAGAAVRTFLPDPSDPSVLYAGAAPALPGGTGGVFESPDGGQTWQPVGGGLSNAVVTSLVKDAGGAALHAGIYGGGVANLSFEEPERPAVSPPEGGDRQTRQVAPR